MIPYGDYPDPTTIKRVLVVKLRHHGDVLLTTPVFSCLKEQLSGVEVDVFIYQETLPMLAGNPWIDRIHCYDSRWKDGSLLERLGYEVGLIRQIRARRYDVVINLTEGDRGTFAALLSGAAIRVGWMDPEGRKTWLMKRAFTHLIKRPVKPRHMVEQNLDALRRIGIFPEPEERSLHLHVPPEAEQAVQTLLRQAGVAAGGFVAMHLTSRWLFKCWPLAKNIELIKAMQAAGYPIVLTAAPDTVELDLVGRIQAECGTQGIINLAGQLSLKELAAVIQASRCLVTIDSVPLHIASAFKKATLVLFGPSSEEAWGPWQNPEALVCAAPYPCRPCNLDGCGGGKVCDCLAAISVTEVLQKLQEIY